MITLGTAPGVRPVMGDAPRSRRILVLVAAIYVESAFGGNCASGQYGSPPFSSCTDCPSGTYSATQNSQACQSCPAGMYQASSAQTTCSSCPVGSTSALQASAWYILNVSLKLTRTHTTQTRVTLPSPDKALVYSFTHERCYLALTNKIYQGYQCP